MPDFKRFMLPDTAEGLTHAEILAWHVEPGDDVTVSQIIVAIETAKAAVELPRPWAGRVTELLVEPGQTVEIGAPIIVIDVDPNGAAAPTTNGSQPASGADDVPTWSATAPRRRPRRRRRAPPSRRPLNPRPPGRRRSSRREPVVALPEPEPVVAPPRPGVAMCRWRNRRGAPAGQGSRRRPDGRWPVPARVA